VERHETRRKVGEKGMKQEEKWGKRDLNEENLEMMREENSHCART
jgi:hypothetical protein